MPFYEPQAPRPDAYYYNPYANSYGLGPPDSGASMYGYGRGSGAFGMDQRAGAPRYLANQVAPQNSFYQMPGMAQPNQTAGLSGQYNNTPTDEYGDPLGDGEDYYSDSGSSPFIPFQQPQERNPTQFRRSQDQLRRMQEASSKAPAWRSLPGMGQYGNDKKPSIQELMQLMQIMR